jgi:hypothetical protein
MKGGKLDKKKQLKIDPGTASSRLKKEILFKYVKKAGDNFCFQCGSEIENSYEMSVEHKTPWLHSGDPLGLFFDLDNIAFSHLDCNVKAARPKKITHGTQYRYCSGCRCDECKNAHALNNKKWRDRQKNKEL